METKVKRPPSVWITQIALVLLALTVVVNAGYIAVALKDELFSIGMIFVLLMMLALASVPLIACRGLGQRRPYGRYLAILFFAFVWLLWVVRLYSSIVLIEFENIDVNDRPQMM